jgi:hypothetical protein
MKAKRYTEEQIVEVLREADANYVLANGHPPHGVEELTKAFKAGREFIAKQLANKH